MQAHTQANEHAISQLKAAISRNPNDPALHYELAGLYLANLHTTEAMASYQQALRLAPNHPQILLQLGNTATAAHQYAEAVHYLKLCIQADPNNAAAHYNLGNTLRALGQFAEAASNYRKALTLAPNDADTHNNLGNVLRELGQLDEAIACYEQALTLNPQLHHALAHLIHQQQHICDWKNLNNRINQLRAILKQDSKAQIAPFAFLAMPGTTAEEQLHCASQWAQQQFGLLAQSAVQFAHHAPKGAQDKIKIAYLSADFRLHPLAFLITELLEQHDRSRFHISAYSYGPNDYSAEHTRIVNAVDHFEEIHHLNDIEAAKRIHAQAIDILVDLTGYTKNSRTGIIALKPAPISINWLGFAGSMGKLNGKSLFDYMIVDETIGNNPSHFSEQLIALPCYQPNNSQRPVAQTLDKVTAGLPQDAFVFCCFNQTFKITAEVFAVWMRVLKQVPNSVLWLLDCNLWAKRNLLREVDNAGIAPTRIIFAPRVAIDQHLARHVHADVFLDTLPYNAHTTASDALWMGVPVITCMGDTMASRVAASLLHTLQLDNLITQNLPAYEAMALSLALNPTMLAQVRAQLVQNRHLLFNVHAYTKTLEQAYIKVYNTAVTHS
ncbi:MAG TPA: tetratricopeptide repeat protein [Methylophilus sp.]